MEAFAYGLMLISIILLAVVWKIEENKNTTTPNYNKTNKVIVKMFDENAKQPIKGTSDSAGWDIFSSENKTIAPFSSEMIQTGINVQPPFGSYIKLHPRSGNARKFSLDVGAGVVDRDYKGEIGVIVFNHGNEEFKVTKGMAIAQMVMEKYNDTDQLVVYDEVLGTRNEYIQAIAKREVRGLGGFGSTD